MNQQDEYENIILPVYVVNFENRVDCVFHINNQFKDRLEFDVKIIKACESDNKALGLWKSIVKIVKMADENDEDVIIICEDDHVFTENYSKKKLIDNILKANEKGANVLIGGVSGFVNVVPITNNLCWVDTFSSTQFLVIYKQFFKNILVEPFTDIKDTVNGKFSEMTSNKMVFFPFISVQKEFGSSEKSESERNYMVPPKDELFKHAASKIKRIYSARDFYFQLKN